MADDAREGRLAGGQLALAAITLALANFMVVLDTTIANVSVPHIAGSLGISPSQGIWIITSYAVAEAICVPLTGWLAQRFGAVRTFFWAMVGFTAFSVLCGISSSLGMLIVARIGQGLCGGPLMPLSQTLLLRIFGREKTGAAMGIWSVTTVIGPILGPILGGIISDNASWNWIFFINVPVGLFVVFGAKRFLSSIVMPTRRLRLDVVGLALLVVWVGALQLILDLGRERDWFDDRVIVILAIVAAIGFAMFLAWELTEREPVVDLRVFRHRGFTAAVIAQSAGYAAFFAGIVLVPQWLQQSLGYTATWAGYATAFIGVGSLIMSPIVAKMTETKDARLLACIGLLGLGFSAYMRVGWTSDADFWTLSNPQLVQGFFTAFFFIPLATLALGSVKVEETASAAGLMSFLRTVAGAFGASIGATMWNSQATVARSEMAGRLNSRPAQEALEATGMSLDQVRSAIERIVDQEALAVSTNHLFLLSAIVFVFAATIVWFAPKPTAALPPGAAH
ncbi:DHA2 family multidrug resistance protein [Sphingomonas sp. PP-F2F-G114-C0414]|uniref:DHA2 family efflux MFS transporter permease subunit n=1 Tax=Sphingomonas sp. PP-F2F-G114-C0414 TaxID=2135662 RepID=UPI000EF9239D|nr:DHA2 family efflux MFS transporter permease subunit [Sphingomonas sp. PP-F2F-G114-C0414]RMB36656.1 DHA2 family multidrug resistance protein [Sphingomonas sp. PP-F2F-G114-C0414]